MQQHTKAKRYILDDDFVVEKIMADDAANAFNRIAVSPAPQSKSKANKARVYIVDSISDGEEEEG